MTEGVAASHSQGKATAACCQQAANQPTASKQATHPRTPELSSANQEDDAEGTAKKGTPL